MAKKLKSVKCEKCGLELQKPGVSEEHQKKAFVWDDKVLCENCLVMTGGTPTSAMVWSDFQKGRNKSKPHDW